MESAKNQNLGPTSGSLISMITFFFPICGLVNANVSKLETSFLCRKLFMKWPKHLQFHLPYLSGAAPHMLEALEPTSSFKNFQRELPFPMTRKNNINVQFEQQTLILNITFIFAKQHPILSTPPSFLHWHQICVTFSLGFPPHFCFRFLFLWSYISMLFEIWSSMQHICTFQMCMEPL